MMSFRLLLIFTAAAAITTAQTDTFSFLESTVHLSKADREELDQRRVIVRILPAGGHELAAVAAASVAVGPDAFLDSVRHIAELKKGNSTPQIGRFSQSPRLEDMAGLTLDDSDVAEIAKCNADDCGLKLSPTEISHLHAAAGGAPDQSRASFNAAFRQILLEHVDQYLRGGDTHGDTQFSSLLQHSALAHTVVPQLSAYMEQYPTVRLGDSESFFYWSKETYAPKPMITLTHVTLLRGAAHSGMPDVIVASREIYSTRYTSGSLVLALLVTDRSDTSKHYLVYVNHTWVDGLRALWRPFVEHRVKTQAKVLFATTRDRIESWPPRSAQTR